MVLEGEDPTALGFHWHAILKDGLQVGSLTNCVWSYRLKKNIGFALISSRCRAGEQIEIHKESRTLRGMLTELPFL